MAAGDPREPHDGRHAGAPTAPTGDAATPPEEPTRREGTATAEGPTHPEGTATAGETDAPPSGTTGRGDSLTSRLLIAGLCVLLGFAIVAQVRQTQGDEFSSLRQDDLVRLLDEVTQRNEDLAAEQEQLQRDRAALRSGSDASQVAEDYLTLQGILAGTVAVEGPGVVVTVEDPDREVTAQTMVHMLEELRNAGAEAVELSGQRLTASSAFVDTDDGVAVNGVVLDPPYEWRAIGDAHTLSVALDIPGGALAGFRNDGASVRMVERELVQITAVRDLDAPEYAQPVEEVD